MQRYIIVTDKASIIRSNSKLVESFTFTRFCFSLARLFVTLTCCLSYSRSKIFKYIWYFSHLIVTLTCRSKVLTLENIQINLIFCSLIRTLTCRSKLLSLGSKNITYFILYFSRLFVTLSSSRADCALYGRGWAVGQDIYKGVYYALVLTFWNRRKISRCKSETKQR